MENGLEKYIVKMDIPVLEAIQVINRNAQGVIFVIDQKERLVGSLTDGDVRRFILKKGDLTGSVDRAMFLSPHTASNYENARHMYHEKNLFAIPIVDSDGHVIDIYFGREKKKKILPQLRIPVVINAGGKGTRLDPYTRVLPKPLIPIGDRPIIEHIMERFMEFGCDEFHIIVNYKKEIIKAYFSENEKSYHIQWYDENRPLGTGGGLSFLKGVVQGTFFFTNCDILLRSDFYDMYTQHKAGKNDVTIVCAQKKVVIPYGVIEVDDQGKIKEMQEKPDFSVLTNTGLYIVESAVLDNIQKEKYMDFPDFLSGERKMGKSIGAYIVAEREWMDMGQFSELEKMKKKFYENE